MTGLLKAIFQPYVDIAPTGDLKPIVISGPDLMIGERALTSLALVLHELATNAAKYGALSISEGLVHVTWQIAGNNPEQKITGAPPSLRSSTTEVMSPSLRFT